MKIKVINKSSNRKPACWCPDIIDAPPLDKK
jgi:hypothetical protein